MTWKAACQSKLLAYFSAALVVSVMFSTGCGVENARNGKASRPIQWDEELPKTPKDWYAVGMKHAERRLEAAIEFSKRIYEVDGDRRYAVAILISTLTHGEEPTSWAYITYRKPEDSWLLAAREAAIARFSDRRSRPGNWIVESAIRNDVPVQKWYEMSPAERWWHKVEDFESGEDDEDIDDVENEVDPSSVTIDNWWHAVRRSRDPWATRITWERAIRYGRELQVDGGDGALGLAAVVGTLTRGLHPEAMEILRKHSDEGGGDDQFSRLYVALCDMRATFDPYEYFVYMMHDTGTNLQDWDNMTYIDRWNRVVDLIDRYRASLD